MRRFRLSRAVLAVMASLVIFSLVAGVAAAAIHVWLSEAPLNPTGEAFEVNPDASGAVWISDVVKGEVWRVQPGGAYTAYAGLDFVWAARPGAPGEVWYGSTAGCTLGRLSTAGPSAMTWTLGTQDCSTLATAYDGSRVWVTDYANHRLYSFDNTNLCTYTLPGGLDSQLAVQGGQIWYGDSTTGRILRVNPSPATPQATSWQLPAGAKPYGLVADPDGSVWWTDPGLATVNHFEPDGSNSLTAYAVPAGSRPELLALFGDSAWYSDDLAGAIGQVDPAVASGVETSLTPSPATVSRSCQAAPAGTPHAVTVRSGILPWTSGPYVSTTTNGVTKYQLAGGALPWGIAVADGNLLAADRGRQVLLKFSTADLKNQIYLPITAKQ